jgi:hypothetical protein
MSLAVKRHENWEHWAIEVDSKEPLQVPRRWNSCSEMKPHWRDAFPGLGQQRETLVETLSRDAARTLKLECGLEVSSLQSTDGLDTGTSYLIRYTLSLGCG